MSESEFPDTVIDRAASAVLDTIMATPVYEQWTATRIYDITAAVLAAVAPDLEQRGADRVTAAVEAVLGGRADMTSKTGRKLRREVRVALADPERVLAKRDAKIRAEERVKYRGMDALVAHEKHKVEVSEAYHKGLTTAADPWAEGWKGGRDD